MSNQHLTTEQTPSQPAPRLVKLANLLEEWQADADAAHEARVKGIPRGPVTGLPKLDADLGGCFHPGITILHGGPGVGKTACGLQVAASCGCPALYVTCEMGTLELFRRVTARVTETFLGRLKSGELTPAASLALARQAATEVPQLAFVDATTGAVPPGKDPAGRDWTATSYLRECAGAIRGDSPHLLLVVDSLHSWAETVFSEAQEYEALNAALAALRVLSSELRCPALVIAERNREKMSGGLHSGAGTRKIEYGGEAVIGLAKVNEDAKPDPVSGEVEVIATIHKNRNGDVGGKHKLQWRGALQRFREV